MGTRQRLLGLVGTIALQVALTATGLLGPRVLLLVLICTGLVALALAWPWLARVRPRLPFAIDPEPGPPARTAVILVSIITIFGGLGFIVSRPAAKPHEHTLDPLDLIEESCADVKVLNPRATLTFDQQKPDSAALTITLDVSNTSGRGLGVPIDYRSFLLGRPIVNGRRMPSSLELREWQGPIEHGQRGTLTFVQPLTLESAIELNAMLVTAKPSNIDLSPVLLFLEHQRLDLAQNPPFVPLGGRCRVPLPRSVTLP